MLTNQPRKTFKNIDSLAGSIKENGVIQPIIVTAKKAEDIHYIIVGKRRYLAAKQAGLTMIPCIVRQEESDADIVLCYSFLKMIKEKMFPPFEEADALRDLIENKMSKNLI
ncbi:MAG: ParB N-terminal domain-containing protein [Francisella endosymbiont of Hyalomma scupense]